MSQRITRRPHIHTRTLVGVALSVALAATACSSDSPEPAPPADDGPRALPQGSDDVDLDPADFTTDITNPYLPLEVGDSWAYEGTDEESGLERIEVTVLDETFETALGIATRVVRDTVTVDGEVVEDTRDWYAQDQDGNVWYFGEETGEYEDGEVVTTGGSWEAGVGGAAPGIAMPADPRPGQSYRQEYLAGEAEDQAVVLSADEQADVTLGHYDDVVMTRDTNALEPEVSEFKFYARGMGQILVLQTSGGAAREDLVESSRARG
jgi:hypothetical protein